MKKTNNKGFSLIELIIVIAIMAILVAIIAPNLTKYLGKSKTSTDKKNADEIASQVQTSISDYESQDDAGALLTSGDITIEWPVATPTTASYQGNVAATVGAKPATGDSFLDIVNQNITSSTKSKVNAGQPTTAKIEVVSGGKYKITVRVGGTNGVTAVK